MKIKLNHDIPGHFCAGMKQGSIHIVTRAFNDGFNNGKKVFVVNKKGQEIPVYPSEYEQA